MKNTLCIYDFGNKKNASFIFFFFFAQSQQNDSNFRYKKCPPDQNTFEMVDFEKKSF